ncbi:nucleolar protein dao-5-like [Ylistrum balloti]|uniref:nucleolar protein dao-5-like n=1 Tax=Ylistrum balloti TaxID=509963 RepID=UPI002905C9BC|nr:nucleolar protein dao-5-like [Ylistrum balloti]
MKGVSISLLLLGLVLGSLAKTTLKDVLDIVADRKNMEKVLEQATVQEIRDAAECLQKDFNEALKLVKEIVELDHILDTTFRLNPKFEVLTAKLGEMFNDVEMDVNKLPDLTDNMDDWMFLDQCVEVARNTDFNQITDKRDFLNEVFNQIFACQASGLQFLVDLADIRDLADKDVTKTTIGRKLIFLEAAVIEMAHLLKFKDDFVIRVLTDYDESTHNELVHGPNEGGHKPSPSPSPSPEKRGRPPVKQGGMTGNDVKPSSPAPSTGGPKGTRPPPEDSSEEIDDDDDDDDDDDEDEDDERSLLIRILNVLRRGKKGGNKGKSKPKGSPSPVKTTPAGPKGTRPPPTESSEEVDEDDDDNDDDADDERSLLIRILNVLSRGKKGGKKGKSKPKGSPSPVKTTPAGPKGTRPPPTDSSEESDEDDDGRSPPPGKTTPAGPKGTRPPPTDSSEEVDEDDDEDDEEEDDDDERSFISRISNVLRGGKKGNPKSKGSPPPGKTTPAGPKGTRPPPTDSSEEVDEDDDDNDDDDDDDDEDDKRKEVDEDDDDNDDDEDDERSIRILNVFRKSKPKGSPSPVKTTPAGPKGTRPPPTDSSEESDEDDDGRSPPPGKTTPAGPKGTRPPPTDSSEVSDEDDDDDEDEDDERSLISRISNVLRGGKKAGKKGKPKTKGSPPPGKTTPAGPKGTRPPPKDSSEENLFSKEVMEDFLDKIKGDMKREYYTR